jgi:16S rRNA (uracil1498-N3)-methyltransferase
MRSGDRIEIVDSAAQRFAAEIFVEGRAVRARLTETLAQRAQAPAQIAVAQGIPKAQKMDYVVEKLTELGVAEIVPLRSERSVAEAGDTKIARWRRLARSAAQQCGRADIPDVREAADLRSLTGRFADFDRVLFPWELASAQPLRESLPPLIAAARRVLIVIGPEGGFSHDEADLAGAAGAHRLSLGERILRTETAALVLVAIINYLREG